MRNIYKLHDRAIRFVSVLCLLMAFSVAGAVQAAQPVKVFILAGQSNMDGHGETEVADKGNLKWLMKNTTNPRFKRLMGADDKWTKRNDVFIRQINTKRDVYGPLTVGFGSYEHTIGPELMFGNVLGDYYDEDILIIKTAWGGRSLGNDFLSPSAVKAAGKTFLPEKPGDTGYFYKEMISIIKDVTANIAKYVPGYKGQGYQIVGFGWHQGWNDRVHQPHVDSYTKNLKFFINDLRKDLDEPNLPFVMATSSMALDPKYPRSLQLVEAQKAILDFPEFKKNVSVVDTKAFWREQEVSPSKQGFHWNRNAESYCLIGEAMGEAMWEMTKKYNKKVKIRK